MSKMQYIDWTHDGDWPTLLAWLTRQTMMRKERIAREWTKDGLLGGHGPRLSRLRPVGNRQPGASPTRCAGHGAPRIPAVLLDHPRRLESSGRVARRGSRFSPSQGVGVRGDDVR